MPRYRLKHKEIIAIKTNGEGLVFETPDGKKFDQYGGGFFEALLEEIKPLDREAAWVKQLNGELDDLNRLGGRPRRGRCDG